MSFLSRIRNFGISAWAGKDCRRSALSEDIRNIQEELRIRHSVHTRDSSRMNIILNTLAITFKTNAAVALAQTFHRNLKRAFSRIISIYEEAFGKLEKKTRYHALLSSMGICLGARRASWYDDIPPRLRSLLDSMIVNWREKYSCALPCVFPSNIKDNKAEIFLSWSYELLMHLDACSRLEDVTFRKGDLKRTQLLPLASHKMKFIQIDKSILFFGSAKKGFFTSTRGAGKKTRSVSSHLSMMGKQNEARHSSQYRMSVPVFQVSKS